MNEDTGVVPVVMDKLYALIKIFSNGVGILIVGLNNHVERNICFFIFDG